MEPFSTAGLTWYTFKGAHLDSYEIYMVKLTCWTWNCLLEYNLHVMQIDLYKTKIRYMYKLSNILKILWNIVEPCLQIDPGSCMVTSFLLTDIVCWNLNHFTISKYVFEYLFIVDIVEFLLPFTRWFFLSSTKWYSYLLVNCITGLPYIGFIYSINSNIRHFCCLLIYSFIPSGDKNNPDKLFIGNSEMVDMGISLLFTHVSSTLSCDFQPLTHDFQWFESDFQCFCGVITEKKLWKKYNYMNLGFFYPSGHCQETVINAHVSAYFR